MKKNILVFSLYASSLFTVGEKQDLRTLLHNGAFEKPILHECNTMDHNYRDLFHNSGSKVEYVIVQATDITPPPSPSRYDSLPLSLVQHYKTGGTLTHNERKIACMYLYEQIKNTQETYEIFHSEHAFAIWRFLGFVTLPARYMVYLYTHKVWQDLLDELAVEENTEYFD
jgi:hypothetical protein